MKKPERDGELSMFTHLSESICHVASELGKLREQQLQQFQWYTSHHGLATKCDVERIEQRILELLQGRVSCEDKLLLDGLLKRSEGIARKLGRLDEQTKPAS